LADRFIQALAFDYGPVLLHMPFGFHLTVNTLPKFNSFNTRLGGRIALTDNRSQPLVVVGVTPSVVGVVENTCNRIGGYCYV
jgi:hypothetical protein